MARFHFLTKNILNSELLLLLLFFNIEKLKKEKTFLNILNSDILFLVLFLPLRNLKKEKTFSIIFNIEKF